MRVAWRTLTTECRSAGAGRVSSNRYGGQDGRGRHTVDMSTDRADGFGMAVGLSLPGTGTCDRQPHFDTGALQLLC